MWVEEKNLGSNDNGTEKNGIPGVVDTNIESGVISPHASSKEVEKAFNKPVSWVEALLKIKA